MAIIAVLASTSTTAQAEGTMRCIDYSDVNEVLYLVKTRARCKYVYIQSKAVIKDERLTAADVRMWLERNGQKVGEIEVKSDLAIALPVVTPDVAKKTKLCVNQPKKVLSVAVNFGVHPPADKEVAYNELFVLLEDVNDFTDEMAGLASWFISDKDVLEFKFIGPATIEILSKTRPQTFRTSVDFKIEIERHKAWKKENPTLRFSVLPVEMNPKD